MLSKILLKKIYTGLVVASAVVIYAPAPPAAAQSASAPGAPASRVTLDYEFFKTRVEPIFLKKRSPNHARCYVCHLGYADAYPFLVPLSPGNTFWTEEQSRRNFKFVSALVVPGNPTASRIVMHPLAPEAGGLASKDGQMHNGGRQFESQNDPDWLTLVEWVRGKKASGASAP